MIHYDAHQTFRGLPLTTEQEAEVRHYLNRQRRWANHGIPRSCGRC